MRTRTFKFASNMTHRRFGSSSAIDCCAYRETPVSILHQDTPIHIMTDAVQDHTSGLSTSMPKPSIRAMRTFGASASNAVSCNKTIILLIAWPGRSSHQDVRSSQEPQAAAARTSALGSRSAFITCVSCIFMLSSVATWPAVSYIYAACSWNMVN